MPIILPTSQTPRNHLVVPDEHYYPGDNFRRCEWLGQYIVEKQPEVIVRLGDMWDMPSLCHYERGKKSFMFQSVKEDIESGHKAEELIFGPMLKMNAGLAKQKKKQYTPLIVKILGNHEHRVQRVLDFEPRWEGSVSMDDFNTRLPIDEIVVPFGEFILVDDIAYSHYFASGVKNTPCSSARLMLQKKGMSCTMGHIHTLDHASFTKPTGETCKALIAGSFHDPDHESFAGPQVDRIWWNGLIMKHKVLKGNYDVEEVSIKRLQEMYERAPI